MSSPKNNDVSVVILTRNSARTIEQCLKSVIEEKPREILAVDALSTDETRRILTRYGVTILLDPLGSLGYSRQLGVERAKGAFVMFVDSDVELGRGCVRRLRSELEKYGWAGIHARILSRVNLSYWQGAQDEAFSLFFNRPGPRSQIGTIAALFRREVLLRYPFDPNLRESCEDVDLCRRLEKNMHRVGVSSAVAYHHHRREFSTFVRHRFCYGLGDAELALKYRSIRILIEPLQSALFQVIYSIVTRRIRLVPYWLTSGLAEFVGVVLGLSWARGSSGR